MGKKRDYKQMMGWFIIIVMVLSVGGIIGSGFNSSQSEEAPFTEYNGYKIYQYGAQSQVQIAGQTYTFQYSPVELENLTMPINVLTWLNKEKIYLAYDPQSNMSINQQLQFIGFAFYQNGIIPQQACTTEEGCGDIPIINCENDGIILLSSTENIITKDNKCLVLEAENTNELQKMTERFVYGFLGVMN
ncbi:MAG: hypothetical protein ABIH82_02795 [Candidatus Woesearchaeota archaeon]